MRGKMKGDRITIDLARMNRQPCIRDMRLDVRRVVELAASYPEREEFGMGREKLGAGSAVGL